jgi:predicted N-acyltransferase
MKIAAHETIDAIAASAWNALDGAANPFLRHEFLAALEHTGCVRAKTGWRPQHLTCTDRQGAIVGALPLYLKDHSFGEFVFDWAWADAYHRAGLAYYPKLLAGVPFSPVTGRRLLIHPDADAAKVGDALIEGALELARKRRLSSAHCLFTRADEVPRFGRHGFLIREDCQFHWHNRGYTDFEDFLQTFASAKRKKVRRERRRVAEAGIRLEVLTGERLDSKLLDDLYRFYALTFRRRGRPPYLNRAFFAEIAATMGPALVVVMAWRKHKPVAAAICLQSDDTLYGRHWGCEDDYHSLHFETCYYQGVDYCIAHGLAHFEPGTQGEHKVSRGFEPTATWSVHWLAHPAFREAIGDYLEREQPMIENYIGNMREHLPFRRPDGGAHRVPSG